jgi:hypothetical protein
MASSLICVRSRARSGSRSIWFSAYRRSTVRFWPSFVPQRAERRQHVLYNAGRVRRSRRRCGHENPQPVDFHAGLGADEERRGEQGQNEEGNDHPNHGHFPMPGMLRREAGWGQRPGYRRLTNGLDGSIPGPLHVP